MTKQRKTEWLEMTKEGKTDYHERQYKQPYRSTVTFCNWLESLAFFNKSEKLRIADIGAGQGANLFYMAKRYPNTIFVGIELNPDLVKWGNEYFTQFQQDNCQLVEGDLYNLSKEHIGKYDGIVSYQTLMAFPEYKTPIRKIVELQPKWIAITSLFFDGDVNCEIKIQDYTIPLSGNPFSVYHYNIYSIPMVRKLLVDYGYSDFKYIHFEIDIDLPKPKGKGMGTYTEKLQNGKRIQISGPILMSWYFVVAKR